MVSSEPNEKTSKNELEENAEDKVEVKCCNDNICFIVNPSDPFTIPKFIDKLLIPGTASKNELEENAEDKVEVKCCNDNICFIVNPSDPFTIPKFIDKLLIPGTAKPIDDTNNEYKDNEKHYHITMKEAEHYFSSYFPPTKIWGYNGLYPGPTIEAFKNISTHVLWDNKLPDKHFLEHYFSSYFPPTKIWGYNGLYPGPTIEAFKNISTHVLWDNKLPDKHFLPYDTTLHGTVDDPEGKTVVHLHGAKVESSSDGHPEAWFTNGFKVTGPEFTRKVYEYTNYQSGTTLWYHDHAMGQTRLNVYAGLAGFYILRDLLEERLNLPKGHDHAMGQTRLNVYAGLAGFYILRDLLEERLNLPKGKYEVPLLVQDKSFTEEGELFYPAAPPFPVSVFPSIVPGFFGDTIVVNGKVWPYLDVEPRKYRFRILNASNRRQYIMRLSNNEEFIQIGTDGGLIEEPVNLTSFKLMPAERIDIIIDFSQHVGERIILMNDDTNADISGTNMIMRFNVVKPLQGEDTSVVPSTLRVVHPLNKDLVRRKRKVSFGAMTDRYGRPMLMIDNMTWSDPVTEKPELDSIEIWNLINPMPVPHPIHIHLIQFKILWRRPFDVEAYNNTGEVIYTGPKEEPHDYERGFKDTVDSEAGKVTRIIMQFKGYAGNYVWHCHFLEHEEKEEPHDYERGFKDTVDSEAGKVTRIIMQFKGYAGNYVWHCHFLEHEDYEMMRPLKVVECNCVK